MSVRETTRKSSGIRTAVVATRIESVSTFTLLRFERDQCVDGGGIVGTGDYQVDGVEFVGPVQARQGKRSLPSQLNSREGH